MNDARGRAVCPKLLRDASRGARGGTLAEVYEPHSHCSWCGQRYEDPAWPRACSRCGNTTWLNPTPVGVLIVPVDDGALLVRRGIEPRRGELALPGGYIAFGESWQQGAARELFEETGVAVDPADVRELMVASPPRGNVVLIFGVSPPLAERDLPPFAPNDETLERVITRVAIELAFPLHTLALARFFGGR
ncbi:MAG: NUDIX domain-containing protein [Polyangiales bacterium]